ncbi:MAG: sigma-70 family RNA polymerase sigma factor [Gammaproteobacteria bacterium]|nr:sigma-70 family RNA polymerase sigma factor [Gammaproteobacteria bacterium]
MSLHLRSLAYGMLGSMADAEDALQEAQLRLHQTDPKPDSEEAFLYRVVSNLCVDKLRKNKVQRKYYKGPWLPEPVASSDIDLVEQAQELSMGFLVLLESLAPTERVVYVLREAFDFSFAEIASVLDMSVANARQHAYRGRVRIKNIQYPTQMSTHEQKELLEQLVAHVATGNIEGVVALISENAVAYTDGGGMVSAAIQPIHGNRRIAQVTVFLTQQNMQQAGDDGLFEFSFQKLNHTWALVVLQYGVVHSCAFIEGADGQIERIYVVRNPHKLAAITS